MFGIKLSLENMPVIAPRLNISEFDTQILDVYLNSANEWYIITGYVHESGMFQDWAILPAYLVRKNYDYDINNILSDWDQIVRK